jgi:iron complex transport system ATP-binding protein
MISIQNISYQVGQKSILTNINADLATNKIHVLLGPNGSGKSTLLKIIAGQIKANTGDILMDGNSIQHISLKEQSKTRSFLQQQLNIPFPITVDEVIMMGRYPHFSFQASEKDYHIVNEIIDLCNLYPFKSRLYHTLSGGEQQRVQFARVLAQIWEPSNKNQYLLLDEPLNNLDIQYQKAILEIVQEMQKKKYTIIMVVHDLNWALQYAQNVLLMNEGTILFQGAPKDVINSRNIESVFNIHASFWNNDAGKYAISF